MKRIIFMLLLYISVGLLFSFVAVADGENIICTDSDNGNNPSEFGGTRGANHFDPAREIQVFNDNCRSGRNIEVTEYYCENDLVSWEHVNCREFGKTCFEGRCVSRQERDELATCVDYDNGVDSETLSYVEGAKVSDSTNEKYVDYCDPGNNQVLYEFVCEGGNVVEEEINCEYNCWQGRCLEEGEARVDDAPPTSCTESDQGNDLLWRGETEFVTGDGITLVYEDFCVDGGAVKEFFCLPSDRDHVNDRLGDEIRSCSGQFGENFGCVEGECVEIEIPEPVGEGEVVECVIPNECTLILRTYGTRQDLLSNQIADITELNRSESWRLVRSLPQEIDTEDIDSAVALFKNFNARFTLECDEEQINILESSFECNEGVECIDGSCPVLEEELNEEQAPAEEADDIEVVIENDQVLDEEQDEYTEFLHQWKTIDLLNIEGQREDGSIQELHVDLRDNLFEEGLDPNPDATLRITQETLEEISNTNQRGRAFFEHIASGDAELEFHAQIKFFDWLGGLFS